MNHLADSFPKGFHKDFAKRSVKIGTVLRMFVPNTIPPKVKRLIITGISVDKVMISTVYINSEINPNIYRTQDLKDLHYCIEEADYLDKKSYVDCADLRKQPIDALISFIENNADCVLGEVEDQHMKEIRKRISAARTISIAVKKDFGLFYP